MYTHISLHSESPNNCSDYSDLVIRFSKGAKRKKVLTSYPSRKFDILDQIVIWCSFTFSLVTYADRSTLVLVLTLTEQSVLVVKQHSTDIF